MQYHPDHTHETNTPVGLFEQIAPDCAQIDRKYKVGVNNRALHGDHVFYTLDQETQLATVVDIKTRQAHRIPAVLIINKTKIIGTNSKKVPIYRCVPVDWRYPDFMVASKCKDKFGVKNPYILIEFHQWQPRQKMPQARQVSIIGEVGELDAELKVILHKNNIYHKRWPKNIIPPSPELSLGDKRITYTDNIYAIDPADSRDFDDAFHVRLNTDQDITEIGIHIADVTAHFTEDWCHETDIRKRLSTIYLLDQKFNMIPDQYADNLCSLVAGQPRLTVSVILYPLEPDRRPDFQLSRTTVTMNMSYMYANKLLEEGSDKYLKSLAIYFKTFDAHQIVEKLMVTANKLVGQALSDAGCGLIRVQKPVIGNYNLKNPVINEHFLNRSSTSAEYAYNPEDKTHFRLQLESYTHFTSPIRRYPDIIVHRLLKTRVIRSETACTLTDDELDHLCSEINIYYRRIKKLYREQDVLRLYHTLNTDHKGHIVTSGYPMEYANGMLYIYLPEFKIEYRYRIFSSVMSHLVTETSSENTIHLKVDDLCYDIELYKLYDITLTTNTKTAKLAEKIKMRIKSLSISADSTL